MIYGQHLVGYATLTFSILFSLLVYTMDFPNPKLHFQSRSSLGIPRQLYPFDALRGCSLRPIQVLVK